MFDRRQFLSSLRCCGLMAALAPLLGTRALAGAPLRAQEPAGSEPSLEDILADLETKARTSLGPEGNCAQTTFTILQEQFGLAGDDFHRALSMFPGVGFRGETCGAVVGGLMALGLVFGYSKQDPPTGRKDTYLKAQEFCRRFEEERGSTKCRDIHTAAAGRWYDLLDPAEAAAYRQAGGAEACRDAVASGVRIAAELILQRG
jgi:C_GCAxxG_C_C family probable redox protein